MHREAPCQADSVLHKLWSTPHKSCLKVLPYHNLVRQNLINKGVLTVKTDLVIDKDLEEIEEAYNRLKKSVEMLKDGLDPKKKTYPKLKDLKLKHDDRFEITKFGKEFIQFIINEI